jgi:hypothetical protein
MRDSEWIRDSKPKQRSMKRSEQATRSVANTGIQEVPRLGLEPRTL